MASFKQMVRPVVEDAAQSLEYSTGYPVSATLAWFDAASDEDVQAYIMGYVQDGICAALNIDREHDYSV